MSLITKSGMRPCQSVSCAKPSLNHCHYSPGLDCSKSRLDPKKQCSTVCYKTKVRDMIETREKGALRCRVDKEELLKIYWGLKEGIGMKAYLHGPLGGEKPKAAISGGGPGFAGKEKGIYV